MHSFRRRLHHFVRVTRGLKTWQLFVVFGLMLFVTATLLRIDNLGMVHLRKAVAAADKTGDDAKIRQSLTDLQQYVTTHMNTSLDNGVYLESSYARAQDAAIASAGNVTNPNSAVYEKAAAECKSLFAGGVASYQHDYLPCVMAKINSLAPGTDPQSVIKFPPVDYYHYNFISPLWSPDIAGFAVLITGVVGLLIIGRLILSLLAYLILRRHHWGRNS